MAQHRAVKTHLQMSQLTQPHLRLKAMRPLLPKVMQRPQMAEKPHLLMGARRHLLMVEKPHPQMQHPQIPHQQILAVNPRLLTTQRLKCVNFFSITPTT